MTTNVPSLITIKLLSSIPAPNIKEVQNALANFGVVLQYEASNLMFDGNSLVPTPAEQAVAAEPSKRREDARKAAAAQGISRAKQKREAAEKTTGPIKFEPGSGPDKVWQAIRNNGSLTSTEVREKTGLNSNIVNTTIYRLKQAGMIRKMEGHMSPDSRYTSTEWDKQPE